MLLADLYASGAHHDASWVEVAVAEREAIERVEGIPGVGVPGTVDAESEGRSVAKLSSVQFNSKTYPRYFALSCSTSAITAASLPSARPRGLSAKQTWVG